jgi:hypothetical protein
LRKTPCAPILEPEDVKALYDRKTLEDPDFEKKKCSFCGRVFGTYTNMRRHVRNACKIAPNAKNGDAGMEILYEHTIRRQETRIAALERQNAEILGMMRQLVVQTAAPAGGAQVSGEIAVHNRDGTVAVDNSRKEIHIHIHGQEGLDHITPARIKAILDETLGGAGAGVEQAAQAAVLKTAMLVYSDPEHPENLTAYLPNKKTNDVLVRTSREGAIGWEVKPASLVLPPMAQKSVDTLFDRQPYEEAEGYGPLMKELADNEKRYAAGTELRPILVRNKVLLARVLKALPLAGEN